MRVMRASDYRTMPWKNGQGSTTEVAVAPPGAGLDQFDWRVSLATVSADGPFSRFEGIDRTLTVLTGAGIMLHVEGRAPVALTPQSPPHAFAGDVATSADLLGGTVTDFNVMSRRSRLSHRVRRLQIDGRLERAAAAGVVLLYVVAGRLAVTTPQGQTALDAADSLVAESDGAETWTLSSEGPATAFWIELRPVGD